jgi:metallo-beta-lactamase class B
MLRTFALGLIGLLSAAAIPALILFAPSPARAANEYLVPFPAHHVIANIYYVGSKGQANYLITTPAGNILINSGLEGNVPMIKDSIAKLGFKYSDTKILLISHAHFDHDAGSAQVIKDTGAKYEVMDADVPVVESGGKLDFNYGDKGGVNLYPPTKVNRVLHDGDTVSLGGTVLTAHKTPGHTKGCTTWTMKVEEGGKPYDVVFLCGVTVPGYKLVDNAGYPNIVSDYEHSFAVLKSLPCDVFLGAHGAYFGLQGKLAKLRAEPTSDPFIDPVGYHRYLDDSARDFHILLAKQQKAALDQH